MVSVMGWKEGGVCKRECMIVDDMGGIGTVGESLVGSVCGFGVIGV